MRKLVQREDGLWTVLDAKGLAFTKGLTREEAKKLARRLNRKPRPEREPGSEEEE